MSVSDRFGDNGITGLAIILLEPQSREATIDTFLMSCRVIGRKIEFALMDFIVGLLHEEGYRTLHARYAGDAEKPPGQRFLSALWHAGGLRQ